ncbi:hypothetical protein ACFX5K_00120 [Rickettsiales bacterium LUAb2]
MSGYKLLKDTVNLLINNHLVNLDYDFEVVSEINSLTKCNLTLYNLNNINTITSDNNTIEILLNNSSLFKSNFIPIYRFISSNVQPNITVTKTNVDIITNLTMYVTDLAFKQDLAADGGYIIAKDKYLSDYFSNAFKMPKGEDDYQIKLDSNLYTSKDINYPVSNIFYQILQAENITDNYIIINGQIINLKAFGKTKLKNIVNTVEGVDGSLRISCFYNPYLFAGLILDYRPNQNYIITKVLNQYNYRRGFYQELECLDVDVYNNLHKKAS